jgi:hypothetical protein
MAIKTLRVFAEFTSTGFVPMPTAGNIDYGYTLASTFPSATPSSFQTDDPDLDVTVTAMTDFYVWIRINGTAWNPSYTRNVRVYPDSPDINNVVMNMIIATGPAGTSAYSQIVQTSNRLYFNGATVDTTYDSKFAGKTYINELNFGTAPQLATVATSGAYADLTGKPALSTVATSGLYTDLSAKPSGTAPISYNSGTNSFQITQASTSTNGFLSSADWNTFNNKQGTITLTTSGTSGASTFVGNTLNIPNYAPNLSVYVPYTGATTNVNLGTHSLTAADLVVNHVSGSGVAASITKGGNGEALTVVKTSGSGNAASITGGVTLLDELHLNTDLVDAYIASATNWNTAYTNRIVSASAPLSITSNAISITQANTTTNGFLSSTDWNTFNSKQNALTIGNFTEVNSNVFMFPDGTTGKTIGNLSIQMIQAGASTNGYLSSTDWTTFNNKQSSLTFGNFTETTSSVLTITGGTNAIIGSGLSVQVKQANTTTNGFLSSTDWNTFNSKQSTITLTTTGTSGASTFSANTLNIPQYQSVLTNPVTGTGTTNYIPKWTSSSAVGNSIIFADSNNVGINVTPPTWYSNFKGINLVNGSLITYSTNQSIFLTQNAYFNAAGSWTYLNTGTAGQYSIDGTGTHVFYNAVSGTGGNAVTLNERMRITSEGVVSIGTTTPQYGRLNVKSNGTASYQGFNLYAQGNANFTHIQHSGSLGIIGTSYDGTGGTGYTPLTFWTSDVERMRIASGGFVGINTTAPEHRLDVVTSTEDWAARIYNTNGNGNGLLIRTSSTSATGFGVYNGAAYSILVKNNGNTLMGTTSDPGYRLYVNGTIYATGNITANSDLTLKKNLQLIENPAEKLISLNGYSYQWKSDDSYQYGVIAQEVEKVMSYAVQTGSNGIKGVAYNQLTPLLIEGFKVHETELQTLKKRVTYLETKLG